MMLDAYGAHSEALKNSCHYCDTAQAYANKMESACTSERQENACLKMDNAVAQSENARLESNVQALRKQLSALQDKARQDKVTL